MLGSCFAMGMSTFPLPHSIVELVDIARVQSSFPLLRPGRFFPHHLIPNCPQPYVPYMPYAMYHVPTQPLIDLGLSCEHQVRPQNIFSPFENQRPFVQHAFKAVSVQQSRPTLQRRRNRLTGLASLVLMENGLKCSTCQHGTHMGLEPQKHLTSPPCTPSSSPVR